MLFGHRESFGIQSELLRHSDSGSGAPIGRVSLWISGEALGDGTEEVLSVCTGGFECAISATGKRRDPALDSQDADAVAKRLIAALFCPSNDPPTMAEADLVAGRFNDFVLCPYLASVFDDDYVFLIDDAEDVRVIWRSRRDERFKEVRVAAEEFTMTLGAFCAWCERLRAN